MKKKIILILGNRPQFIKAAPLSKEFKKRNLNQIIIHTGQHYETKMSNIFFSELNILKPKYFLNVKSKYHGQMTGKMIEKIEKILLIERPELVFVFGDTNSTLAGAIAASKLSIPLAHIEAGLRSFNNQMPEEINRIITDRISKFLFCPTTNAVKNLKKEALIGIHLRKNDILPSGEKFFDVVKKLEKYKPLGFIASCVSVEDAGKIMKKIKKVNYPIGFKINAFRHIPIGWKPDANNPNLQLGMRKDLTPKKFFNVCKKFKNLGAKIIGGCCEISPKHIQLLRDLK